MKESFGQGDTRVEVLRGIDLTVERGKNPRAPGTIQGAANPPLSNIIGGIDGPDSGSVAIAKEKIEDMNEKKLSLYRRKHLGYVFQQYNLIANLTVKENIEVGAYLSDAPLDVDELLHVLGLWDHKDKLPQSDFRRPAAENGYRQSHRRKS